MKKSTASKALSADTKTPATPTKETINDSLGAFLSKPKDNGVPPLKSDIPLTEIDKTIGTIADKVTNSTARYFTFDKTGKVTSHNVAVCFHAISGVCDGQQGLGIVFQGYGGFLEGDRWRAADEADLYTTIPMPFHMVYKGHYNAESLSWLEALLNPEGPFKSLLPLMLENKPEEVQARRCFIFPDISLIPARLTWCFAIASRLGFANPRVLWRYLHLLGKGVDMRTAFLIAGGFEHEVKNGQVTGRIIKSYTAGFLGVDVTAYAGRMLTGSPVVDKPFKESHPGTYGSSEVFKSGTMDLKKMTFDDWDEVITYVQARGLEQSAKLKIAA